MIRRLYIILLFICCFVATEGQVVGDSMYIYRKDKPYHLYDLNEIDYIEFEKSEIQWIRLSDGRLEVYFIKDLDSVSFVKPAPPAPTPGTYTVNGVSFKLVEIEGGTFQMHDYSGIHDVTVGSYSIGETEVTQALWQAVMGNNPSTMYGDDLPVNSVNWDECMTFINKLNELLAPQIGEKKFDFPTEVQWEYAARGGNQSHGYEYSGGNNLEAVAWYENNSNGQIHQVATKTKNELGLYDMSGNVYEWCKELVSDGKRACRGGSWYSEEIECSLSWRDSGTQSGSRDPFSGLRLVLNEKDGGGDDHENGPTKCTDDNHPHMIDLGLPSGTKWACCNVGASIPEDYGNYYDWGQTEDRLYFDSDTYDNRSLGNDIAGTEYDVAYVRWGSNWCMPNKQQFEELAENTTQRWITQNGVDGMEFEGKNGGKIFLPAGGLACGKDEIHYRDSGHYWSTTQYSYYGGYAHPLYFNCDGIVWNHYLSYMRCWGHSVRPVVKK